MNNGVAGDGDKYTYRSPYEAVLNEIDIQKVCFVPLSFPDGFDDGSIVPGLLINNYCIDFDLSKQGLSTISESKVDLLSEKHDSDPGSGGEVKNDGDSIYFPLEKYENGMYLWTYRQDGSDPLVVKSKDNGISPYQYDLNRNKINHRYVAVVYDRNNNNGIPATTDFPSDSNKEYASAAPKSDKEDPFLRSANQSENNWLAIGLDFNKK